MPSNDGRNKKYNLSQNRKRKPVKKVSGKKGPTKTNKKPDVRKKESVKVKEKQSKQNEKVKKDKNKFANKYPKLSIAIKVIIIIFLLLCVVGAGIVAGMFFGLFGDEFEITKNELKIGAANSVIVDANGTTITSLSGDEKRKVITLEDMADYLPKAYVAIEDERFYKHNGVDIKRTAGAIVGKVLGKSSYGGSTITQQLVKNITKDDETSGMEGIMRKVKEWAKAYQVERMISKQQILELYLNILYIGGEGNLHGVELGSQYYFNKSAKDLDLAECAFLAGINSSPSRYNPYKLASETDTEEKRNERIKNKTLTVLAKMKELGYIENEEEYNTAVAKTEAGLPFQKGETEGKATYSYHTNAVIEQVIKQVMEEKEISRQLAENYVYSSGLTIYSTVNSEIQARLEEEYAKAKYSITSPSKKQTSQSGMAIVDYKTGHVLGVAGGLGEPMAGGWNRATQMKKQTGSSMKPLATVAPGLEEKIITASTIYNDTKTDFGGNYTPKNYNEFRGPVTIREFIETSQNIPAIKIMAELTPAKSLEYLKKMGITSLDATKDNILSLAIGGMTDGVSPLEMAVAYGTIANDGVCVSPTFYTKVVDSSGNVVLTPEQTQTRAISEQNAYIAKTIIQEPVKGGSGTAKYCAISGMDVAAKTGTTDHDYDRWLCGFTPYYAAATWFGYDDSEEVKYSAGNPAGLIWDAVMTDIHKNLPSETFTKPSGIVEQTVCKTTGCLATTGCGNTYTDIFTSDNLPEKCEGHGSQRICTVSGKVANSYCPSIRVNNYGASLPKEQLKLWKTLSGGGTTGVKVNEYCTIHTKPVEKTNTTEPTPSTNTTNTTNSGSNTTSAGNTGGGNGGGTSSTPTPTPPNTNTQNQTPQPPATNTQPTGNTTT